MSDDALIAGAAAPYGRRRINSRHVLDAVWVIVTAVAMLVSSAVALVDLPNQSLRTGDAPLRVWVIGLPLAAVVAAVIGAVRRSTLWTAAATGLLAPSIGFTGSVALSLFLDDDSAFADAGVAVSLGAAFVGVVMSLRWFVYHPADLLGDESRPTRPIVNALAGSGLGLAAVIVVTALADDGASSASFVLSTLAMTAVPATLVGAALLRTRDAMVLAGAASFGLIVAVVVVRLEQSSLPLDSVFVVRAGPIGLAVALVAIVLCVLGFNRHAIDDSIDGEANDDTDWRWSSLD